jgi:CBS domain containing-hemolysin-like protein
MDDISLHSLLLRAAAVIVLVAANAFFVAAEFSLVASRRTRIQAMVRRGDRRARSVQVAIQDLYRQLSAAQLGITLASILLGYVAEDTVAVVLHGWLTRLPAALQVASRAGVASVVAVGLISFLHVVLGEQAPKAWAITHPEVTGRWIATPLMLFSRLTRPATNLLNWSAGRVVRLLGISGTAAEIETVHSPDEIVMMLRQSQLKGHIDREDVRMIEGVFEFTEKTARDVMTARTDMAALPADVTVAEAADHVTRIGRSRYPVYGDSLDDIIGVVHVKQIFAAAKDRGDAPLRTIVRAPLLVPGTREVEDVLADMKRLKTHIAIVLDEYGGTAGIVTMEDLLEEIVGEIYDEYDRAAPTALRTGDAVTLPGEMEIEDVNERFALKLSDEDYTTIGGYVFGQLGRLPRAGDTVRTDSAVFEVLQMDGRRVASLRMVRRGGAHPPTASTGP